jgi:hypothetical protein
MSNVETTSREVVPLQAEQPQYHWYWHFIPTDEIRTVYWGNLNRFLDICQETDHRFTAREVKSLLRATPGLPRRWDKIDIKMHQVY